MCSYIVCSGSAALVTQARRGIPDTYPTIKIIGATIKVLATDTDYNGNLRRANRVLLHVYIHTCIHARKRKFKINRRELWDD